MDIRDDIFLALLEFDGFPDELALPREQRQRYKNRAQFLSQSVEAAVLENSSALLAERDKFIVDHGLWTEFVESLR